MPAPIPIPLPVGTVIGFLTVTGPAESLAGHSRSVVACTCGVTFVRYNADLRTAIKLGSRSACNDCYRLANSARCGKRIPKRDRKLCWRCAGLAHRRRRSGCPECRQPYAAEPPLTLDQAMAMPGKERREAL